MNDQTVILIVLIVAVAATLWLSILKAKKEVEYKKDERWQLIQIKANHTANLVNWLLIVLLAVGTTIPLFIDVQTTFTLQRVVLFGELFIGLRNLIELAAVIYFDKKL